MNRNPNPTLPSPRPQIFVSRENQEVFLVDEERGEVYEINETAAHIFRLCQQAVTLDQAVAELLAGLRSPKLQQPELEQQELLVREDVCAVARQLEDLGICPPSGQSW